MGYDLALFVDEPNRRFVCTICLDVVEDNLRSDCDHLFCRLCILKALEKRQECPIDKRPLQLHQLRKDALVESLIGDLQVKCRKHAEGCDYKSDLYAMTTHLCGFELVNCSYRVCEKVIPRSKLAEHMGECIHRTGPCRKCNSHVPIRELEVHTLTCDGSPIAPKQCICRGCQFYGLSEQEGMCSVCFRTKYNLPAPVAPQKVVLAEEEEKYILSYQIPLTNIKQLNNLIRAGIHEATKISAMDTFLMMIELGCRFGKKGIRMREAQRLFDIILPLIPSDEHWKYYHAICPFVIDNWNIPNEWGVGYCYYGMIARNPLEGSKKATEVEAPDLTIQFGTSQVGWSQNTAPTRPLPEVTPDVAGVIADEEFKKYIKFVESNPSKVSMVLNGISDMSTDLRDLVEKNYGFFVCALLKIIQ